MNERDYIEIIGQMRENGLCKTSEASAKRYAAQLTAGTELTIQLQAAGILESGETPLDVTREDKNTLDKLNRWQALQNLDDKSRAAVKLLLKILGEEPLNKAKALRLEQVELEKKVLEVEETELDQTPVHGAATLKRPRMIEMAGSEKRSEPPLSLYGLLTALRQTTKNRRKIVDDPAHTLIMRALLQNDEFYWTSDTTEIDLHVWGSRYKENAAVIAANLREEKKRQAVVEGLEIVLQELEDITWDTIDGEQKLRLDVARACGSIETAMEDWYILNQKQASAYPYSQSRVLLRQLASMESGIGAHLYDDLSVMDVAEKLADLFQFAIEAAEGIYTPAYDLNEEPAQLTDPVKQVLAIIGCGLPVPAPMLKAKALKELLLELTERGILVPYKKNLAPAPGVELDPLTILADGNGSLKKSAAADFFRKLLTRTSADYADAQLRETLLCSLEDLTDCLEDGPDRQAVLQYMMEYFWIDINGTQCREELMLLERLVRWNRKYPDTFRRVLDGLAGKTGYNTELRLLLDYDERLLDAVLQTMVAQICLELAQSEDGMTGYWSVCAANEARKALVLLDETEEPGYRLKAQLILALALALQGNEEARMDENKWPYTAKTLVRNYLLPCLLVLREAEQDLKESWLTGPAREQAEEILKDKTEDCHIIFTGEDSSFADHLRRQDRDFLAANWLNPDWIQTGGMMRLADRELFQVMHHQDHPAKLFLPWYCNTFDSTLACGPECTQELTEAGFMNILLSGQKVAMAANQMADNEHLWNMTDIPAFLWCLKRGYISTSLFGNLHLLGDYVSGRMKADSNFIWSSLPEDFHKPELRAVAGKFLKGQIPASYLPLEYRQILTKMRDAIRLMDENMPESWINYYHQQNDTYTQMRQIPKMIPLEQRVADYYSKDRSIEHYDEMRRLNEILIRCRSGLNRSDYRKMIWAIRDEDFAGLEGWNLSPSELEQKGLEVSYLAAERKQMLEDMIHIIDDCQNRMLGERISTHQYYVYSEAATRIVPEWHTGPVNRGGRVLYRQIEKEVKSTSALLGWEQVPERITELQRLADENPNMDAERLCSRLANRGLYEYDVFGLNSGMRLKSLRFRTSTGKAVSRQYTEGEGNLQQMEKDLTQDVEQGE